MPKSTTGRGYEKGDKIKNSLAVPKKGTQKSGTSAFKKSNPVKESDWKNPHSTKAGGGAINAGK